MSIGLSANNIPKIERNKVRMLKCMSSNTLNDRIRNLRDKLGIEKVK